MIFRSGLLLILTLSFLLQNSFGGKKTCTSGESEKADMEAGRVRTWDALYRSYTRFGHCDDGSIAEGYSDSVGRILSENWKTLPRLAVLSANSTGFRKFVLRHVDATVDTPELKKIRTSAIRHCTPGNQELCEQLVAAATAALKGQ